MDDTLYLERDYVASGFRAIAKLVSEFLQADPESVYEFLMHKFLHGVRGRTFDMLLEQFSSLRERFTIQELVAAYRQHQPDIQLLPGIKELLHELRRKGIRTALLSDGYLVSQRLKANALKLERLLDKITLTDAWGRNYWKPHPHGFKHIEKLWGLHGSTLVYVGDNPLKDFVAPNGLGWHTIRLRLRGQLHYEIEAPNPLHAPAIEVTSVKQLLEVLLG
jgi:putative hydrolase of the HAD superfamily